MEILEMEMDVVVNVRNKKDGFVVVAHQTTPVFAKNSLLTKFSYQ